MSRRVRELRQCYEVRFVTVNPVYTDRGSDHETRCNDFFQCYADTEAEALAIIERLSREPEDDENEYGDDQSELDFELSEIDHFYFRPVIR